MTAIYWIATVFFGALVGSFLNVVIFRGPSMWGLLAPEERNRGTLLGPRSYCPACRAPIPFWRLLPVASYFLQGGRCATCGAKIPIRYPLVELAGMAVAAAAFAAFGLTYAALLAAIFGWSLLALAVIDLETGFLPDWLTLPLIAAGLIANATARFVPVSDAIIGAGAGYAVFRAVAFVFLRLRRYEGLGQGDAKLLAAVGAWCGWAALPGVVLIGSMLTLAGAGFLFLGGRAIGARSEIPFGPGLCAAGFVWLATSPVVVLWR